MKMSQPRANRRLIDPVDPIRDHVRGGAGASGGVVVVVYGDFLCPYCRRLVQVLRQVRRQLGDPLTYVFRHFPNDRANPGALLAAYASEAAASQGKFWEMHDALLARQPPLREADLFDIASALGLDVELFGHCLRSEAVRRRVELDIASGRRSGVAGAPTLFVQGERYDGAWDLFSILEAVQMPVANRVQRTARAFASLPASAGLVLLIAAALALVCANSPLAGAYARLVHASLTIGPAGHALSMTTAGWCSEGLLAVFFVLVGLEIRRETTRGTLTDWRVAALPAIAAVGGVLAPTAIFLALNPGVTAHGWGIATATDIAFALGVLALLGDRVSTSLRVFVAALAVVDDMLSLVTLALFYSQGFDPVWLGAAGVAVGALALLNGARVYAVWPYLLAAGALWFALHAAGVHAALAGLVLAAFLPNRPEPAFAPLLAQAATALASLEHDERMPRPGDDEDLEGSGEVRDWATRNLAAASERLLAPAERVERGLAPWTSYVVLPCFAFSAAGVPLSLDLRAEASGQLLLGVALGLCVGKPLGIGLASWLAIKVRVAVAPDAGAWTFLGAACVCGVGDTVSLLLADQAFPQGPYASIAKIGVLAGSALAAAAGAGLILQSTPRGRPPSSRA